MVYRGTVSKTLGNPDIVGRFWALGRRRSLFNVNDTLTLYIPHSVEMNMSEFDELVEELKQKRDEAKVRLHLASKEIEDEWAELEKKMDSFSSKVRQFSKDAKLKETGSDLGDAIAQVGKELKSGYERIRAALNH